MGLEEILKQVEETGKEKAAEIRKATVEEVEAKATTKAVATCRVGSDDGEREG